jgi:hypothetical protein
MQTEVIRNAQSPDAASRKIKSPVWFSRLAETQKLFFVEKVARGRDVTLALWTGEWHDIPSARSLQPHSRQMGGCDFGH